MPRKIDHLILDTVGFISNVQFQELAENSLTCEAVIKEIKCRRQLYRLANFPQNLKIVEPDTEDIIFVTEFSKKTGDYPALSSTDIKVLALTYKYHKQLEGVDSIRTQPVVRTVKHIDHSFISDKDLPGFYTPPNDGDEEEGSNQGENWSELDEIEDDDTESDVTDDENKFNESDSFEEGSDYEECDDQIDQTEIDELVNQISKVSCKEVVECDQNDPCVQDSDAAGWITLENLKFAKSNYLCNFSQNSEMKVACLSTDFAVQNVLLQMGLKVISVDGLMIKDLRTFVLRCYSCFKTTTIMTKVFCRNCGNKTLKRVAVEIDENGKQQLLINLNRPLTGKGKKHPVRIFQGGKYAVNPIISEDQRIPNQYQTKLALSKTKALAAEFIAASEPFVMRDVNSKSAILGFNRKVNKKAWMRNHPSEALKSRRKKK